MSYAVNYILSIDPGTSGTAWALWDIAKRGETLPPTETFQVLGGEGEWIDKFGRVTGALQNYLNTLRMKDGQILISQIHCEWPRFMESEGGQKSATSGALVKLCCVVGAVAMLARQNGITFVPVEVNDWKGQMTKTAVEHRVKKRLGEEWCHRNLKGEHMYHAVGIGLHWKGMF